MGISTMWVAEHAIVHSPGIGSTTKKVVVAVAGVFITALPTSVSMAGHPSMYVFFQQPWPNLHIYSIIALVITGVREFIE